VRMRTCSCRSSRRRSDATGLAPRVARCRRRPGSLPVAVRSLGRPIGSASASGGGGAGGSPRARRRRPVGPGAPAHPGRFGFRPPWGPHRRRPPPRRSDNRAATARDPCGARRPARRSGGTSRPAGAGPAGDAGRERGAPRRCPGPRPRCVVPRGPAGRGSQGRCAPRSSSLPGRAHARS